jgi:hypothetical protein
MVWHPSQWASGAKERFPVNLCPVCGGAWDAFDHTPCKPSLERYIPPAVVAAGLRQYRGKVDFATTDPRKTRNSVDSVDSVDSVERSDSALIDAIAEAGVVVRPVDIGGDRRFCAEANGKVVASEHFPTWRASALAGLARARGDTR